MAKRRSRWKRNWIERKMMQVRQGIGGFKGCVNHSRNLGGNWKIYSEKLLKCRKIHDRKASGVYYCLNNKKFYGSLKVFETKQQKPTCIFFFLIMQKLCEFFCFHASFSNNVLLMSFYGRFVVILECLHSFYKASKV